MSRVRVTIEGEYDPQSGYVQTSTGARFGYCTDDNAIAGASYTIEILPDPKPKIKAGQVWEAGGTRWLVAEPYSTGKPLWLVCSVRKPLTVNLIDLEAADFENSYPERKLILDA